jgi:hypothetical protein
MAYPETEKSAADRRSAAIERTSGMFAHLAPGASLADELIADRRVEMRAEEEAEDRSMAAAASESPRQTEDEGEQPPFTCIGAFSSGRGDLSKLASEDVFEPEPFR